MLTKICLKTLNYIVQIRAYWPSAKTFWTWPFLVHQSNGPVVKQAIGPVAQNS